MGTNVTQPRREERLVWVLTSTIFCLHASCSPKVSIPSSSMNLLGSSSVSGAVSSRPMEYPIEQNQVKSLVLVRQEE